ncbi:hypothetical protein Neosp_013443 [[Neocosmospora] mangrovei]
MAQQFQNNLEAFKASLTDNRRFAWDSLRRFDDYRRLVSGMHPDFKDESKDETEDEIFMPNKTLSAFYRLVCTNELDHWIGVHDQEITGGVLTAQTASQKRLASTRAFAALAIIDWRRRPVVTWDPMAPIEGDMDLLESFARKVCQRLASMHYYDECTGPLSVGPPVEAFVASQTVKEGSITAMQTLGDRVQCLIRRGRRWRELVNMVGLGVILIHDPLRHFRSDLQTFYIPSIVENGSDRQFTRLKEIIPTRLQWLTETCAKLGGLVPMLTAASTMEQKNATAIQDGIQKTVTAAFGNRSSVEEALLNNWAQQDVFQQRLTELLRSEAATIPLDVKVEKLETKKGWKPEIKEDVYREAEGIMERDCSTLDSESRKELRVWSHKRLT